MNYDRLLEIAKNDPALWDLIQKNSEKVLEEVAGPQVLVKSGGHFSIDKRLAGSLRDGMNKMGKAEGGRTGFLLQAKSGDMSGIGGPKISAETFKNAESSHSQFSRPAKGKINAYNQEFSKVMDVLQTGDSAGMKNTGATAAQFGERMGDNNFFGWAKRPNILQNNPVPDNYSLLDMKTGRVRADLDDTLHRLTEDRAPIDPKLRPYLDKVLEKSTKDLPINKRNMLSDFKNDRFLEKDKGGLGMLGTKTPKMPWEQMSEAINATPKKSLWNLDKLARYAGKQENPIAMGARLSPNWNSNFARQNPRIEWQNMFNNPGWTPTYNQMSAFNTVSSYPKISSVGASTGASLGGFF